MLANLNSQKIKKILLIKLKGIGDVVLSTIVLDNLKCISPLAEIDFLTEPPSKTFLENLPQINKVIILNKKESLYSLKTIFRVASGKYDLVIDMYSNPRTAMLTFMSFAKFRAGFPYRGRTYAYNLFGPKERGKVHSALLHLELLKEIGLPSISQKLHFGISRNSNNFARAFFEYHFKSTDNVIGISPSGGWESKKCEAEYFVEYARAIKAEFDVKFLLVWGPGDKEDADYIVNKLGEDAVLAPSSSILEMGSLMKLTKAVIANDSGPMHIAAALGVPILSIHGPTSPKLQGPFGEKNLTIRLENLECIECNLLVCPKKHECFRDLPAEKVFNAFIQLVKINNIDLRFDEKKA